MRLAAAGWGTLSAVSLLIGAGIGVAHLPSRTVRAGMMAFGSGALVEALAIELFGHILHVAVKPGREDKTLVHIAVLWAVNEVYMQNLSNNSIL